MDVHVKMIERADPEEVGLRLAAALRARWFGMSDESSLSKQDLLGDEHLVSARNTIIDVSSMSVDALLAAQCGTPARRELTDAFWELDAFKPYALAAVKCDPRLSKLSYKLVPKHTIESEFWRLYFVHVYAALADSFGHDPDPSAKSRRMSTTMTSPKQLPPLTLPRGNSLYLRQEPWARVGGEEVWLLSAESQHLLQGHLRGSASITEGPQAGVAAFAFGSATAVLELGAPTEIAGEWTICCWFRAGEEFAAGERCLACADLLEQPVCVREGEIGVRTAQSGFLGSGSNCGCLEPGWFHLSAVGLRGKTHFMLNGATIGTVDAQCVAPLRFVGNVPPTVGTASQPFLLLADFRAFCRALDEAELVALAKMVPEAARPEVPSLEALASFKRQRAVALALRNLATAADMIAAAESALGPGLALTAHGQSTASAFDLRKMREQLLQLSSSVQSDAHVVAEGKSPTKR